MFVFCGSYVGMVLAMSVCGVLAEAYGWESVFYITGIFGCIWMILWFLIVKRSPTQDRFITEEEKSYIKENLEHKKYGESPEIPWMSIFKSMPFWAIIISQFADNWGLYTLLTQLPLFLKGRLNPTLNSQGNSEDNFRCIPIQPGGKWLYCSLTIPGFLAFNFVFWLSR
jgi:ACS family sodium-dependent inorganic phosphate cotransporter